MASFLRINTNQDQKARYRPPSASPERELGERGRLKVERGIVERKIPPYRALMIWTSIYLRPYDRGYENTALSGSVHGSNLMTQTERIRRD